MDWTAVRARIERIEGSVTDPEANAERERQVLERRATLLRRSPVASRSRGSEEAVLIVRAAGGRYAFPLSQVCEVISNPRISIVPGTPRFISGVMQLRGDIVPVYTLSTLLGSQVPEPGSATSFVVMVRIGERAAGVLVEGVEGTQTRQRPDRNPDRLAPPAVWRTEDLATVLDADQLINRGSQQ